MLSHRDCSVWCLVAMGMVLGITSLQSSVASNDTDFTSMTINYSKLILRDGTRKLIIPRVDQVVVMLPQNYSPAHIDDDSGSVEMQCVRLMTDKSGSECAINITSMDTPTTTRFSNEHDVLENLELTIDKRFEAGCSHYLHAIHSDSNTPDKFTCEILLNRTFDISNITNSSIIWRRFRNETELNTFINNPTMYRNNFTGTSHTYTNNISTLTTELTVNRNDNIPEYGWYLLSIDLGDRVILAPVLTLFLNPVITSSYEFSIEVKFGTRNFSELRCEAESFPTAKIEWMRLVDNKDPCQNKTFYSCNNLTDSDSNVTINGEVTIAEVTYSDSSVYRCMAYHDFFLPIESSESESTLEFRLRVRSRLRPLWPAIGIICVGIVVALFIIIGGYIDKQLEKRQQPTNKTTYDHRRLHSVTSSIAEGEFSNNTWLNFKKKKDHTAIRRIPSAKVELLSLDVDASNC